MSSNNKNEELTFDGSVPQSNSQNTDISSVSTNTNDTTKLSVSQAIEEVREAVRPHNFYKGNVFQHNVLARYINVLRFNGTNHIYRGSTSGIYVYDDELITCAIQKAVPKFGFSQIKEELQMLSITTKLSEVSESPCNYVAFNNGVLDIYTSDFKEFKSCTPSDFILTNKLSIDYTPDVPTSNEVVDPVFMEIAGSDLKQVQFFFEFMGSCIFRCSLPVVFVLTGVSSTNGNDGRDIFLDIIKSIAGNCASFENLQDLVTAKSFHSLYTKTCNISTEQCSTKMSNVNRLVGLIKSNKVLPIKEYGSLTFTPYTTLVFNVRDILDFDGVFSDLGEYVKIIPFNNQLSFDKSRIDAIFEPENLQYITMKALSAFSQVLQRGSFTLPAEVQKATNRYLLNNNSAREFLIENPIFHIERKCDYYDLYDTWCKDNNKVALSSPQFGKEVLKFGYLPARYSVGTGRKNYYKVKDFDVHALFDKYSGEIEINSIDILLSNGTFHEGRFIEAFIDYFHRHTPEDDEIQSLTERADALDVIEKAVQNLPVTLDK